MLRLFVLVFILNNCVLLPQNVEEQSAKLINNNKISLVESNDLKKLVNNASESKLVLLGEASHGTSEYYHWRAEISKKLISEKGYSFIAVEGDWASLYRLNMYVKGLTDKYDNSKDILLSFERWPRWMWANEDVMKLIEWLRDYNKGLPYEKQVGFYGMDVYGQWEAAEQVFEYINTYFPDYSSRVEKKLGCYYAYKDDNWDYPKALMSGANSCSRELDRTVSLMYALKQEVTQDEYRKLFNAKQNAYVVKNAEEYFRIASQNNIQSWNSRVEHMFETVNRLLGYYGDNSKGIVWAHNTHIGDAAATSMGDHGMYNIGNLTRDMYGNNNVFLVGFGTGKGTVNAGSHWGDEMKVMTIPNAMNGSIENFLLRVANENYYLIFDDKFRNDEYLKQRHPHRAIGVTYNPQNERGNYVPTVLVERYDAFIFIPETKALKPVNK